LRSQLVALGALVGLALPDAAQAQTDYFNTDPGRPLRTADAYPVEYRALEFQLAPLRVERSRGGSYHWSLEPGLTAGLLPRTHVELHLPIVFVDPQGGDSRVGVGGATIGVLYNFNVETRIPALALSGNIDLPFGGLASNRGYGSIAALATRSLPAVRLHLNAELGIGSRGDADDERGVLDGERTRWAVGLAADRAVPLHSLLLMGEIVVREPLHEPGETEWSTLAGVRYQLTPRLVGDAGAGYRFTGPEPGWALTAGVTLSLGLPWSP
jgi:hypothetical protein